MIVDCFTYFDEAELLELRIEMLKDVVDGFLICEADRTFKGDKKEFTCVDTIRKLGLPEEKIQVLHCELPPPETHPNPWIREHGQRDALGVGMRMCPEDTVFFLSDVDEIPNPSFLIKGVAAAKAHPDRCVRLSMAMFYGKADLRVVDPDRNPEVSPTNWTCGTFILHEHLAQSVSQIRIRENGLTLGKCDAGWHFSWMGDSTRMKRKLTSFSHCYDFIPDAVAPSESQEMLDYLDAYKAEAGGNDPLGRHNHILEKYPHELLPKELFKLERVKKYLLPEDEA